MQKPDKPKWHLDPEFEKGRACNAIIIGCAVLTLIAYFCVKLNVF